MSTLPGTSDPNFLSVLEELCAHRATEIVALFKNINEAGRARRLNARLEEIA
jgi:hypothetical protein